MKVLVVHGIHDLVAPYLGTQRLLEHPKLDDSQRTKLHSRNLEGGHMFYLRTEARRASRDFAEEHSSVGPR